MAPQGTTERFERLADLRQVGADLIAPAQAREVLLRQAVPHRPLGGGGDRSWNNRDARRAWILTLQ
jgi:hypothetical protein